MKRRVTRTAIKATAREMRDAADALDEIAAEMEEHGLGSFEFQATTALHHYWPGVQNWITKEHGRLQAYICRTHIGA